MVVFLARSVPDAVRPGAREARDVVMEDDRRWRNKAWLVSLALTAATVGRGTGPASGPARSMRPRDALDAIGRRLGGSYSEQALTAMARRADAIVDRLLPGERRALGRGHLRFRLNRPAIVVLAALDGSVPFWARERGFRPTGATLGNPDGTWRLYRRAFEGGPMELGVNGLDRTPRAHYVVFVRPRDPEQSGPGRDEERPLVALEDGQDEDWKLVRARPGVSAAFDARKPFGQLPAELDGAWLFQASHDRRHATLLATGRVWKTHVVSSRRPDQVAIAFGANAASELVWTWRTAPEAATTALRLAPAPLDARGEPLPWEKGRSPRAEEIRMVAGGSTLFRAPNVINDPVVRRHRVAVSGLRPNTVYDYALGDGTPEGWSEWKTVKTAPERGQPVRFLYLGDAQKGFPAWGRLLETAWRRCPDADFVTITGDLVDRGNERTNWDHFFLRAAPVFDRLPLMPVVGNHEYLDAGPRLYRAFFEMPRNGPGDAAADLVYSFEIGDACCAVLDSTRAENDAVAARRQAEWLDRTLARTNASWKIVMFHHTLYPSHPWRDSPGLRAAWAPIMDKHRVDLVLQGHDHAYQRTYPMRANRRVSSPSEGTTYLIAVSGDKFVDLAERDYVAAGRANLSTYQTIDIDPRSRRLTYRAWTEDGQKIDEMIIDKSKLGPLGPEVATAEARR